MYKYQAHTEHTLSNKSAKQATKENPHAHHSTPSQEPVTSKEKPEIQIPQKRSSVSQPKPSPTKQKSQTTTTTSPEKRPQTTNPAALSAIESTLTGFLKQARAANSRSTSDAGENGDHRLGRKRKPLLGRAPSHSSVRSADQKGFSRASSIDTLNEDGCGSAIESVNTDGIPSLVHSGKFDFIEGDHCIYEEDESGTPPPMTQLNYEDPDAIAMREKFLNQAGKRVAKKASNQELVIGEMRELENVGWGTGRRTRNAAKAVEDGF
jgi:DNA replication regulator DPB11